MELPLPILRTWVFTLGRFVDLISLRLKRALSLDTGLQSIRWLPKKVTYI